MFIYNRLRSQSFSVLGIAQIQNKGRAPMTEALLFFHLFIVACYGKAAF